MPVDKLASNDSGYEVGDLSLYPTAIDSYFNLYEAQNNSTTILKASLSVTGDVLVVESTDSFPSQGILRLSLPNKKGLSVEYIYYAHKTNNTFYNLKRGFLGNERNLISKVNNWPINTVVESGVFAEHHNAVRDAVLNTENFVGLRNPYSTETNSFVTTTVNGLLTDLEYRYLAPNAVFRAFPLYGPPPLTVNFHCFTNRIVNRFFWDFGDGGVSIQKNPSHTYLKAGIFPVQLRVISDVGGQGVCTKIGYINVSNQYVVPFGYVIPNVGISVQTATETSTTPTTFTFYDQTDGPIINRLWQFGDGQNSFQENPNIHVVTHQYQKPGIYRPSVLITIEDNITTRAIFEETVEVS
jgi:PKD repeat protein